MYMLSQKILQKCAIKKLTKYYPINCYLADAFRADEPFAHLTLGRPGAKQRKLGL